MKLKLALCFLDENNKIVAEEDLQATWDTDQTDAMGQLESVIVYDEVAAMLSTPIQSNLYSYIRSLLDKAKGL